MYVFHTSFRYSDLIDVQKGFTVILVERGEGVNTKPIKTMYSPAAGTAFITFDNVKVPVENTIGSENNGIFVIFSYVTITFPMLQASSHPP